MFLNLFVFYDFVATFCVAFESNHRKKVFCDEIKFLILEGWIAITARTHKILTLFYPPLIDTFPAKEISTASTLNRVFHHKLADNAD